MRVESTIKPLDFMIEKTENGKCNVHLRENIEEFSREEIGTLYAYDVYIIENMPYHDNLETNIKNEKAAWLEMAKEIETQGAAYSEIQQFQQELTELRLENIEQGQYITELELLILTGGK